MNQMTLKKLVRALLHQKPLPSNFLNFSSMSGTCVHFPFLSGLGSSSLFICSDLV